MKKVRFIITSVIAVMMIFVCSVGAFAAASLSIDAAKEYYSSISGVDIDTLEAGYTWTESNGIVTAVLNADNTSTVSFWYDDSGSIQYDGFFGSSAPATSLIDRVVDQTVPIFSFLGDLTAFVIGNALCMCFLGFMFIVRGVKVLK